MGDKIAFDPSIAHIGYCIFRNGKPIEAMTLHRPKRYRTYHAKLGWVRQQAWELVQAVQPEAVVIEDFQSHSEHPTRSLLSMAAAQGVIFAASKEHCDNVTFVNKGKAKKEQADWLAKHAGLKCDEHGADAYHLGLLAGFDR